MQNYHTTTTATVVCYACGSTVEPKREPPTPTAGTVTVWCPQCGILLAIETRPPTLVDTNDPAELDAHLVDAGDVPAPQPDGYYYLYKRNHRGKWDLTEESDAAVAATYRAYGYQDTTADDFQAKWLENRKRWQA